MKALQNSRQARSWQSKMICGLALAWAWFPGLVMPSLGALPPPVYEYRTEHSADGIGKFYMGREIALVMGHEGADWLERPTRDEEEKSEFLVELLELSAGMVVADIGAGTGYFSRRIARKVGDGGRVLAVDLQVEMLVLMREKLAKEGIRNVTPLRGGETDPRLPAEGVDLVLMVDVYHEFSYPFEMMEAICRALKPEGRVVFVEFRAEDPKVPIKAIHKMTEAQVKKEMSMLPLKHVKTLDRLPRQHVIIFKKDPGVTQELRR